MDDAAVEALKRKFVGYISSISDGSVPYTGRNMKEAHQGMNVKAEEFTAMLAHIKKAFENQKSPEADVQALIKKLEATRSDIVPDAPT